MKFCIYVVSGTEKDIDNHYRTTVNIRRYDEWFELASIGVASIHTTKWTHTAIKLITESARGRDESARQIYSWE